MAEVPKLGTFTSFKHRDWGSGQDSAEDWLQVDESICEGLGSNFDKLREYLAQVCAQFVETRGLGERRMKGIVVRGNSDLVWNFRRLDPTAIFEPPRQDLWIENERLKTQLIEQRRAALLASKANGDLRTQYDRLVDVVCDATAANRALQSALIANHEARLCLHETHTGVVSAVIGDQIEVTYETAEGPLKQIYHRDQFMGQKVPQEGESVEAHVMLATVPQSDSQEQAGAVGPKSEDRLDFRTQNTTETIRI